MRIESQRDRRSSGCFRSTERVPDHRAVSEVDAVENSNREEDRARQLREFGDGVKDVHSRETHRRR